jgi:hypothetical protein
MVAYYDLKPGMVVTFDRSSIDFDKWRTFMEPKIRNPNYTNAEDWYKRTIGKYENVPIKIKGYKPVDIGDALREIVQILIARTVVGNKTLYLDEEWFDLDNTNAFKSAIEEKGRDVRNTRLMAARMGLPHGPESIVSSFVSGIDSKNAAQQNDMLRQKIDSSYVPPDRKRMSGGKTRRGRKSKKTRRTRKH